MKKLIVIGGGAAGLLCAGTAAGLGLDVTVIERNEKPARKVMITGKGRCNVTNNCTVDTLIASAVTNGRFLYSAYNRFTPSDLMELLEENGVSLKTERGNRVFPVSDKACDIVDALVRYAKTSGAKILLGQRVSEIIFDETGVSGVRLQSGETLFCDAVAVTTGGKSYPVTGSTGDGYSFARKCGHTVVAPMPSLVPVETKEDYCAEIMGLSLKNVSLTVFDKKKKNRKIFNGFGEMLFTHFGVSGPLVLGASAHMRPMECDRYGITIDLKPALSPEALDKRLLKDFSEKLNKEFRNSLSELLPSSIIPVIISLSGIDPNCRVNSVTKAQRTQLVQLIKVFELTVKGFRPLEEAIVTSGGVSVSEIDPHTMMSKLKNGLFFAGEVIDIDSYTGGFNLQNAFSTGFLAAQGISEYLNN